MQEGKIDKPDTPMVVQTTEHKTASPSGSNGGAPPQCELELCGIFINRSLFNSYEREYQLQIGSHRSFMFIRHESEDARKHLSCNTSALATGIDECFRTAFMTFLATDPNWRGMNVDDFFLSLCNIRRKCTCTHTVPSGQANDVAMIVATLMQPSTHLAIPYPRVIHWWWQGKAGTLTHQTLMEEMNKKRKEIGANAIMLQNVVHLKEVMLQVPIE
jgi:hypothetical protein